MLLAIVLQDNWDNLIKFRSDKVECDFILIRNCDMAKYIDKFKQLVAVKVGQFTTAVRKNSVRNMEEV